MQKQRTPTEPTYATDPQTLSIENIEEMQRIVVHPALDWYESQLIVGVNMKGGKKAVLSSSKGLTTIGDSVLCERGKSFSKSPVTQAIAMEMKKHLQNETAYDPSAELLQTLTAVSAYLSRFIHFSDECWPPVLALWIFGTYMFPMFQAYPYLRITSSEPGCGKSLLGNILANLSFNGEFMASPTESQLFRWCEWNRGTQVWDEIENDNRENQKRLNLLKPVLLYGYRNGGAVPRQKSDNYDQVATFHVFCPRVLIGISHLPEVVTQRTLVIDMHKRSQQHHVEHYTAVDRLAEERSLRDSLLLTALKTVRNIKASYDAPGLRELVEGLAKEAGRLADDILLPLVSIAVTANPTVTSDLLSALATAARNTRNAWQAPVLEDDNQAALVTRCALQVIESLAPIEPTPLAQEVSSRLDSPVDAMTLSKMLKESLAISSEKDGGRRVFNPSPEEIAAAKERLGFTQCSGRVDSWTPEQGDVSCSSSATQNIPVI